MVTIDSYLNFNGKTEEAFTFYKMIFGGEFANLQRIGETPFAQQIPLEEHHYIMHISLPLGSTRLMGSDILESQGHHLRQGNSYHINLNTESKSEAERVFNALSDGGRVTMPLENAFWGLYFGMLTDKFGVHWMVSCASDRIQ